MAFLFGLFGAFFMFATGSVYWLEANTPFGMLTSWLDSTNILLRVIVEIVVPAIPFALLGVWLVSFSEKAKVSQTTTQVKKHSHISSLAAILIFIAVLSALVIIWLISALS